MCSHGFTPPFRQASFLGRVSRPNQGQLDSASERERERKASKIMRRLAFLPPCFVQISAKGSLGFALFWKLLTWGWWVGITRGRGEGGAGKSTDRLLGNESPCQTKPRNLVISQLGRVSSKSALNTAGLRGRGKVAMGADGVSRRCCGSRSPFPDLAGFIG